MQISEEVCKPEIIQVIVGHNTNKHIIQPGVEDNAPYLIFFAITVSPSAAPR